MLLKILLLFFLFSNQTNASKILAIIPTASFSHQVLFRNIWIELSLRGYHVTLITTDLINDKKLINLTEIDVSGTYEIMDEFYKTIQQKTQQETITYLRKVLDDILDYQLSQESVQVLIRNESLFDVVICESLFPEYQAFAELYKCPKILVSSLEATCYIHEYLGNACNPVSNPDIYFPFIPVFMDFKERFQSFLDRFVISYTRKSEIFPRKHKILKKHFGEGVRSPYYLLEDIDLLLTNTNPLINDIRSLAPNIVPFGGGVHLMPEKDLPTELKDYLDSAIEGCIYFSLGTNSKSMYMGNTKIQTILDTLSEVPYKVLWKFETSNLYNLPKNVKFITWAPQQDILRHPNVKLFITQGGLQSIEESILNHVPMVMLPMFGDQEANSKRMEQRGIARVVPHKPLPDKEEFKSIILDVINNPKYKEKIIKTAELLLDQPMGGVEKAVWWIEYVLRHKGAKHLRNPALDIPFYQLYCLDIIGTIILFIYIVYKTLFLVFYLIKKIICKKRTQKKKKQ